MKKLFLLLIILIVLIFICLKSYENFANAESTDKMLWDNKMTELTIILNNLKREWIDCGFNDFSLSTNDLAVINSRKRLIELLPITKMLPMLNYEQIQCFVRKFDPENYLIISKTIETVPKVMRPRNIMIVNNMLYHSTPYGVLKYRINNLNSFVGLDSLNASLEFGIINDYNTFNFSNEDIFNLEGKYIQKRGDTFVNIKNNDIYEIRNVNDKIQLINTSQNNIESKTQTLLSSPKISMEEIMEKMVDVGGIIQLNVNNPSELKQIDSKTFLPVVQVSQEQKKVVDEAIVDRIKLRSLEIQKARRRISSLERDIKRFPNNRKLRNDLKDENARLQILLKEQKKDQEMANITLPSRPAPSSGKVVQVNNQLIQMESREPEEQYIDANKVNMEQLIKNLITIVEYDGTIYLCEPNIIRPFSNWARQVNEMIRKNKLMIRGIIPHFYYQNDKFNYRLLIILNDDFYISVNKNIVSDILDIRKDIGITFNPNIPDNMNCDDIKIILDQMQKAQLIDNNKIKQILNNYRC
jgi:hypothetical protein